MLTGITLISAGVLILVFPRLLSLIVAVSFMVLGGSLIYISYKFKKLIPR